MIAEDSPRGRQIRLRGRHAVRATEDRRRASGRTQARARSLRFDRHGPTRKARGALSTPESLARYVFEGTVRSISDNSTVRASVRSARGQAV